MIVIDSYMAMILPDDIAERISGFIAGKRNFPFVGPDELMSIMYLYGRNSKIGEGEIDEVRQPCAAHCLPDGAGDRYLH